MLDIQDVRISLLLCFYENLLGLLGGTAQSLESETVQQYKITKCLICQVVVLRCSLEIHKKKTKWKKRCVCVCPDLLLVFHGSI